MLNSKHLLAALIVAIATSFASAAAEDKPSTADTPSAAKTDKKAETKKKVRPHQHPADAKGGVPVEIADKPEGEVKKPLHDHQKFHK